MSIHHTTETANAPALAVENIADSMVNLVKTGKRVCKECKFPRSPEPDQLMNAENQHESRRPDSTDPLAMPLELSLSGCRVSRPAGFGGVEIVVASTERRVFPTRVSESLGICIKTGPSHDVRSDGQSLIYPADSICIRYSGCVWASEWESVGVVSIDIATERLPQGIGYEPMRFLPRASLPNIRDLILSVERSVEPFRKQEALAEIVEAMRACSMLDSDELHVATPRRVIVNRAREYLASRIQSNPSLDEVARAVEANKFVLVRDSHIT